MQAPIRLQNPDRESNPGRDPGDGSLRTFPWNLQSVFKFIENHLHLRKFLL